MDLQLMLRVLWRFRIIVATGLVIGLSLAFLSMVKVNPTGSPPFSYRTQAKYESTTTVFVTVHGFPWGNIKLHAGTKGTSSRGPVDTNVLRNLASVYINVATGNEVMSLLRKSGPVDGSIETNQMLAPDSSTLPLIQISALASTPQAAYSLGKRHLRAFQTWLRTNQEEAGTEPANQIILQPVIGPLPAHLLAGRKKTVPILIFLATLVIVCGLAFVLENLRPRIHPVADPSLEEPEPESQARRLTA
jgi:hypothetical protein